MGLGYRNKHIKHCSKQFSQKIPFFSPEFSMPEGARVETEVWIQRKKNLKIQKIYCFCFPISKNLSFIALAEDRELTALRNKLLKVFLQKIFVF